MIDINQVARRLAEDEGFRALPYYDSEGFLTIGHGILIDERRTGAGITNEESMYLMRNRAVRQANLCDARFDWYRKLSGVRQQVIVCMSYQLGVNGVAKFKRMGAAIERRDFVAAAAEMLDSTWHREQSTERAKRLANMMERDEWIEPAHPINGG